MDNQNHLPDPSDKDKNVRGALRKRGSPDDVVGVEGQHSVKRAAGLESFAAAQLEPRDWESLEDGNKLNDMVIRKYLHRYTRAFSRAFGTSLGAADPIFWMHLDHSFEETWLPVSWKTLPLLLIPVYSGDKDGWWAGLVVDRRVNMDGNFMFFFSERFADASVECKIKASSLWSLGSQFLTATVPKQAGNDCGPWACILMTQYAAMTSSGKHSDAVIVTMSTTDAVAAGNILRESIRSTLNDNSLSSPHMPDSDSRLLMFVTDKATISEKQIQSTTDPYKH
jgi:hypothetical protein